MVRALLAAVLAALGPATDCGPAGPRPLLVTVDVVAAGRSAPEIEADLAVPLERAAATLPGVVSVTSESREDAVALAVAFSGTTDALAAMSALRGATLGRLPADAETPLVALAPERQPVAILVVDGGGTLSLDAVRGLAEGLASASHTVAGIAATEICGGEREITVAVDPGRLAVARVGLAAIVDGLGKAKVRSVDDLRTMGVAAQAGMRVTVSDVAQVASGLRSERCVAYRGDSPVVSVTVTRRPGSDAAATRTALEARLAELERTLPAGATVALVPDDRKVSVQIDVPPGTSMEMADRLAAEAAHLSGDLARWDAARPTRILLQTASPAKLRGLDRPGVSLRFPGAEVRLGLAGDSFEELERVAAELERAASASGVATAVEGVARVPTVTLVVDHALLAKFGVRADDVTLVERAARRGIEVGLIDDVPVRVRLPRDSQDGLLAASVAGAGGTMVPLTAFASMRQSLEPGTIIRVDGRRRATVSLRAARPIGLLDILALRLRLDAVPLPPGVQRIWK